MVRIISIFNGKVQSGEVFGTTLGSIISNGRITDENNLKAMTPKFANMLQGKCPCPKGLCEGEVFHNKSRCIFKSQSLIMKTRYNARLQYLSLGFKVNVLVQVDVVKGEGVWE